MTVLFWIIAVLACAETAFAGACDEHYCRRGFCDVNSNNEPECVCDYDESGDYCDINVCGDFFCKHQAGCKDGTTCVCRAGYTGTQCETLGCKQLQCENDGTCKVNANGAEECQCPPDISGARCEIIGCKQLQCENAGTCKVNANGAEECQCPPDISGARCERKRCKRDVILIFDASASVGADNFQKQFVFTKALFRRFVIGDDGALFGAMVFSIYPRIYFSLNEHKNYADLDQAISNVDYMNSSTNTHLAFLNVNSYGMFSTAQGGRDDAKDIIILITDGDANRQTTTKDMAQILKNQGVTIMAIAVGSGITRSKLEEIVSSPEDIIEATSYDELSVIEKRVADLVCGNKEPSDKPF